MKSLTGLPSPLRIILPQKRCVKSLTIKLQHLESKNRFTIAIRQSNINTSVSVFLL